LGIKGEKTGSKLQMSALRLGLVGFHQHPFLPLWIEHFIKSGLRPTVSIFERVPEGFFYTPFNQLHAYPLPEHLFEEWNVHLVDNLNSTKCENLLSAQELDVIALLGPGAPLLKPRIFRQAIHGTVNVHEGLIPEVRGVSPIEWSIVEDVPLGVSLHIVDQGIDTGPLIVRKIHKPSMLKSLENVKEDMHKLSVDTMFEGLLYLQENGKYVIKPKICEYKSLPLCTISKSEGWDIQRLAQYQFDANYIHKESWMERMKSAFFGR